MQGKGEDSKNQRFLQLVLSLGETEKSGLRCGLDGKDSVELWLHDS